MDVPRPRRRRPRYIHLAVQHQGPAVVDREPIEDGPAASAGAAPLHRRRLRRPTGWLGRDKPRLAVEVRKRWPALTRLGQPVTAPAGVSEPGVAGGGADRHCRLVLEPPRVGPAEQLAPLPDDAGPVPVRRRSSGEPVGVTGPPPPTVRPPPAARRPPDGGEGWLDWLVRTGLPAPPSAQSKPHSPTTTTTRAGAPSWRRTPLINNTHPPPATRLAEMPVTDQDQTPLCRRAREARRARLGPFSACRGWC